MKKILKKSLSLILAITIIFSSAYVGLSEIDYSSFLGIKAGAYYSVSRDDGVWLFPLASNYYYRFTDFAGCVGYANVSCPFCGYAHPAYADGEGGHQWQAYYGGHNGIDIGAETGVSVYSPAAGVVVGASYQGSRGYTVMVKHDIGNGWSYYSYSQHLNSISVAVGNSVSAGSVVGTVGSSGGDYGSHLHFGIVMAPSNYTFSQVLNVDSSGSAADNNWLTTSGYKTGKLVTNPKNGGTNMESVNEHRGSVTYTFDKNSVSLPNATVAPTGITASEKQFTMTVGESKTVTATVTPSNANNKNVTWSSSDTSVATVSNGVIKAVSSGGVTIKATNSAGHEACIEVVVNPVEIVVDGMVEHDGHTYEIVHSLMTWKQAKEYCEERGGHLATITSKEENDAVLGLMEKYGNEKYEEYFIGMTDEDSAGTYTWITGEEFTYENWDEGEPSNAFFVLAHERYQNYGAILKNGLWDDVNNYANVCAPVFGFICEYEKEFTYNKVTIIGDKVYELYEREYPITFANEFAENKGGNLVTITSEKEQTSLIAWIQANSDIKKIAIGASDAENESVWQWLNGEEWGYAPWDDGEPNDYSDGEDYAVLILGLGKWNDVPGANAYSFVIEYDLEEWLDAGNDANDIIFNELPEGADPDDYEIVTEYRYRDKETKTSTSSSLDGLTPYDSKTTYGSWGGTQTTNSKPTESDTLQITGTTTKYKYYHYWNYYDGMDCLDSISYGTNRGYCEILLTYQLSPVSMADQGGRQAYGSYTCGNEGFNYWFYAGTVTAYSYQTRSKTTTYYFYKYGDWSDWSTTPVTSTDDREVESRTVYALKEHRHSYSDWVVETEATCITDGLKSRSCTDCGDVETEVISATGHQDTIWITEQEPTCTVDGYKDEYCLDCTELINTESIPATGHLNTMWKTEKEPTCDEAGYKDEYCLTCEEKVGTEEISAKGHSYSTEWTIDVEPTCTEKGSKSHHCTVCGDKADVTAIDSLGHDYKAVSTEEEHPHTILYKCSRCPETKEETSASTDCAICNFSYTNIDDETCKITGYIGNANSFVMPDTIDGRTVTTTTTAAFKNNTTLISVSIENGVQGLGSLAFLGCTSLSKIVIPESVSSIGTNAFYNCASDFTIYCYRDTYAMDYAIDNSLNYVIMDIGETKDSVIDYKNELIFTLKKSITNILDILYIPENCMAFAEASHISGNNEFLGTGTKITVFENNEISSEYTLVVEGDVNGDSVCDVVDCAEIQRVSSGFKQLEGAYLKAGDEDDNGEIDINDYQSIINSALAS